MNPCPVCGSHAIWEDNLNYGCDVCGWTFLYATGIALHYHTPEPREK